MPLQLPTRRQPGTDLGASGNKGPPQPPKKRRRPALACVQCRRRKIRCDQQKPSCNNCTKSRIQDCTFPRTHQPGSLEPQPATPAITPGRVLAPRTPVSTAGHSPYNPQTNTQANSHANSQANAQDGQIRVQNDHDAPNVRALLARINDLEQTVSELSAGGGDGMNAQQPGSGSKDGHSGLRFNNQSAWVNSTSLYSKVLRPLSQAQAEKSDLRQVYTKCRALGEKIERRLTVDKAPETFGTRMPERAMADEILEGYFCSFEGWLRVLHISSFREEYEKYWEEPSGASEVFILQLQICLALGIMTHQDTLLWKNAASQWLLEAQVYLYSKRNPKGQTIFEELQLACLVLIAEANDTGSDQMHQCWIDVGTLVRKAMCLGLHRDPRHLTSMSIRQAEMRRRLWATILELNLLFSLQGGRPPLISAEDYDTQPPLNLADDELTDEQEQRIPMTVDTHKPAPSTVQVAFLESYRIRAEIVANVNKFGQDMSYNEVLRLHSDLSKAKGRMQKKLLPLRSTETHTSGAQAVLADIFMSRYFLALHLPVLGSSIKNPAFHFTRRFCISTSVDLARTCGVIPAAHTDEATGSRVARLFVTSPGIFRHIAIQAIFAIALEFVTGREEELANEGSVPVCDSTELAQHLKSTQEWAGTRLREGLTDIRPFGFIGACLRYSEILLSGEQSSHIDQDIVEAAVSSAGQCSDMLGGVLEKLGTSEDSPPMAMDGNGLETPMDLTNMQFDWGVDFMGEGMDAYAMGWAYPTDPRLDTAVDMNLGLMTM